MTRNRATFHAMRERMGMTREYLADRLGVTANTITGWETFGHIPDAAWEALEALLGEHRQAVDTSMRIVHERVEHEGGRPSEVSMLYYTEQDEYDEYGRDAGDYRVVDARVRETAMRLEAEGFTVALRSPGDDEVMFQALANTR